MIFFVIVGFKFGRRVTNDQITILDLRADDLQFIFGNNS